MSASASGGDCNVVRLPLERTSRMDQQLDAFVAKHFWEVGRRQINRDALCAAAQLLRERPGTRGVAPSDEQLYR